MQNKNTWFIGDPCYVITDNAQWLDFVKPITDADHHDKLTVYSSQEARFASTDYGDGEYECSFGYLYSVDSGIIGFTPQNMWSQNVTQDELNECGHVVTGDSIKLFVLIQGVLQFVVINDNLKEYYTIDTRMENGDEDEDNSWDDSWS